MGGTTRFLSDPLNLFVAGAGAKVLFNLARAAEISFSAGSAVALKSAGTQLAKAGSLGFMSGAGAGVGAVTGTLDKIAADQRGEHKTWGDVLQGSLISGLYGAIGAGAANSRMVRGPADAPTGGGAPKSGGTNTPLGGEAPKPGQPAPGTAPPPATSQTATPTSPAAAQPSPSPAPAAPGIGPTPSRWSPKPNEKGSVIVDPQGNGSFYSPPNKSDTGGIIVHSNGTKSFWSRDPVVAHTAYNIESQLPGKLKEINKDLYGPLGEKLTDADLVFDNVVVEVKSGRNYDGWEDQLSKIQQGSGRPVIIFAPKLGTNVANNIRAKGYKIFTNEQDLINEIARLHP